MRSGWAKSISCTTGSASPVTSFTIHLRLEEQRLHRLVGFQQRAVGLAQDLVAQIVELAVGQPGLPSAVRLSERTASRKTSGSSHSRKLPRRLAAGSEGIKPVPLVDDRPAQRGELVEERLFDVEVLRHDGSRKSQVFPETAFPFCAHLTENYAICTI